MRKSTVASAASDAAPAGITSVLVARKLMASEQARALEEAVAREGVTLHTVLEREGILSRPKQLEVLENHYFCPGVDVRGLEYSAAAIDLLPERLAKRHQALVVRLEGETAVVAFARPDDDHAANIVGHAMVRPIRRLVALADDLRAAIDRFYEQRRTEVEEPVRCAAEPASRPPGRPAPAAPSPAPEAAPDSTAVVAARPPGAVPPASAAADLDCTSRLLRHGHDTVALVEDLLVVACEHGATDIHLEPVQHALAMRLRIDGILNRVAVLPEASGPPVVSRLKVIAQMDIAERRLPQDGRFSFQRNDSLIDVRVSSLPSQFGEKIVIRLLEKNTSLLELGNLRMPPAVRALYQDMIDNPIGFYLVTGPTGSGKTTTLYATLNALDRQSLNVITLEDPIEYSLPGITQVQMNEAAGLTFTRVLQSILRQDPDVILVGEIRNAETVEIACRSALTGHKVFSTLHTNDAPLAVTRLLDMGCVPYLITSTLRGVLGQRLVRLICAECRENYEASLTEQAILGKNGSLTLYRGRGCRRCAGTGYRGRMALFEYFRMDEKYHRLVLDRASSFALRHAAQRDGMVTMAEYGKQAVIDGVTTVAEIERVVLSDTGRERLCTGCQRVVSIDFAVCPYCKAVLRESCPHCNQPVEPNWEVCATCGREIDREWKREYCPRCDAPQDANWIICPFCGCEAP